MTSTPKTTHTAAITTTQFQNGNEIDFTDFSTAFGEVDTLMNLVESTVSVSSADTHAKHLNNAIAAGAGIEKKILNAAGDEQLQITATNSLQAIINGYFQVDQLRDAETGGNMDSSDNGAYMIDQWKVRIATTGAAFNPGRDSSVLPTVDEVGLYTPYSFKIDVATADASVAAGDLMTIYQPIEGKHWANSGIAENEFTVTFWVRSPKTGVHCVAATNSARDRTYIAEYTVAAADTWEQQTVTIGAFDATADAGTWYYDERVGMELHWVLMAGSTYQSTADEWGSAEDYATSNQVNVLDNTANNFYITNVSVNTVTPYRRSYTEELKLCRRYLVVLNPWNNNSGQFGRVHSTTGYQSSSTVLTNIFFAADWENTRQHSTLTPTWKTYDNGYAAGVINFHEADNGATVTLTGNVSSYAVDSDKNPGWMVITLTNADFSGAYNTLWVEWDGAAGTDTGQYLAWDARL